MNCIIVDDEPLARKAIQLLVRDDERLELLGAFGDPSEALDFLRSRPVDLIFLDIRMPEMNGIELAKSIGRETLVIFTTAYAEYALDSYEVEAIDYLVKPVEALRFKKALEKALNYHQLLTSHVAGEGVESASSDFMYVKSDRRYFKIKFPEILFIEGLKDYVIVHTANHRIITRMNLRTVHGFLPADHFLRVNKSCIVNTEHIDSFDNNDIYIGKHEIPLGNAYREAVFARLMR
ncbi:MAG: LytTR family DNA-binding domain-containing protein [Rikenellaceae bacterium]|nr:LytTR family DNA-binding domain-containing protein [Rikenellaceae bacterium]